MVLGPLRRVKFLIVAPFIVLMLAVINLVTSPGQWWVQWAALGIGIAWVFALMRVLRAIVLAGGLAALGYWWFNRSAGPAAAGPAPAQNGTRPPDIPSVPLAKE